GDVAETAARGADLVGHHEVELAGDDLGGQVEHAVVTGGAAARPLAAVGEQLGGPDLGVEDDVVLAHEVVGQRLRVVPPPAPGVRVAGAAGPLDGRGQVADDGVEPHVEPLGGQVAPAVERDRDAPVDVAGHRPR